MARTYTTKIPLGYSAPDFKLQDIPSGKEFTLIELQSNKATVVMFICNHCPFVVHVMDDIVSVANDYISKGVVFIAINSNDVENYPEDNPENMKVFAEKHSFPFVYLFDENQQTALDYDAACTPEFSVFDGDMKCVYRGQLDGARPGNDLPLDGKDLRNALNSILSGSDIPEPQLPSIGCNIKWKG